MLPSPSLDSEHTPQTINFKYDINISSMEHLQEARAHRAGVQGVQGGDGGVGAAHHAQVMRHICTIYLF